MVGVTGQCVSLADRPLMVEIAIVFNNFQNEILISLSPAQEGAGITGSDVGVTGVGKSFFWRNYCF